MARGGGRAEGGSDEVKQKKLNYFQQKWRCASITDAVCYLRLQSSPKKICFKFGNEQTRDFLTIFDYAKKQKIIWPRINLNFSANWWMPAKNPKIKKNMKKKKETAMHKTDWILNNEWSEVKWEKARKDKHELSSAAHQMTKCN